MRRGDGSIGVPLCRSAVKESARKLSVPVSILDLVSIPEGSTASEGIAASMESARLAERLGYHRLWFAEHHNTPNLASSATALLLSQARSESPRVGKEWVSTCSSRVAPDHLKKKKTT